MVVTAWQKKCGAKQIFVTHIFVTQFLWHTFFCVTMSVTIFVSFLCVSRHLSLSTCKTTLRKLLSKHPFFFGIYQSSTSSNRIVLKFERVHFNVLNRLWFTMFAHNFHRVLLIFQFKEDVKNAKVIEQNYSSVAPFVHTNRRACDRSNPHSRQNFHFPMWIASEVRANESVWLKQWHLFGTN